MNLVQKPSQPQAKSLDRIYGVQGQRDGARVCVKVRITGESGHFHIDGALSAKMARDLAKCLLAEADAIDPPKVKRAEPTQHKMMMEAWNAMAETCGLATVLKMTDSRKRSLKARWDEKDWRKHWKWALAEIPERPFMTGKKGWKATIDWFLKPDSITKIREGMYQDDEMPRRKPSGKSAAF